MSDKLSIEEELLQLKAALNATDTALITLDTKGIVYHWSWGAEKISGIPADEAAGLPLDQLIVPPDKQSDYRRVLEQSLSNGKSWIAFQLKNGNEDGTEALLTFTPIYAEQDKVIGTCAHISRVNSPTGTTIPLSENDLRLLEQNEVLKKLVIEGGLAIYEQNQYIQSILEYTPDTIFIFDLPEQYTVFCNKAVLPLIGYTPEEIQAFGKGVIKRLIYPDDWAMQSIRLQSLRTMGDNEVDQTEYRIVHKNGTIKWVRTRRSIFRRYDSGKPSQVIAILHDITESKSAEASNIELQRLLRERNTYLESIQDNSVDIITACDADFRFTIWNRVAEQYYGAKREDVIGKYYFDIFPDHKEKYGPALERAMQGEKIHLPATHQDTNDWFELFIIPLFGESGKVEGCLSIAHNMTQQLRSEEALLESLHLSQKIAQTSPDIIFVMNIHTYDLVYSNSTAAKLAGFSDEEIARMRNPMLDIVHPDDMEAMIASIKRMISVSDDTVVELEYRVIAADGSIRWFRDRCSVFRRDEAGITVEKMGLTHDFTESKAAVAALIEAEKMATTGELARMIAHEVRNPLTSINLSVEMLRSKLKNQAELLSYIDIINRNNNRINQLITELLPASRPIESAVQKISASRLVDEAADLVNDRVTLGRKKLYKIYEGDCSIMVNEDSVRIAILNLIVNAVEAVPQDTGKIEVKLWSEGGYCYISVEDNGPGITAEKLPYIFESFHTSKPGGMGLGLASARTLITNNNGTIRADSEMGAGTRFTVSFPAI